MAGIHDETGREINLQKLGIREIQERLEVSPIITDPGSFDMQVEDPGGKTYHCSIFIDKPEGYDRW